VADLAWKYKAHIQGPYSDLLCGSLGGWHSILGEQTGCFPGGNSSGGLGINRPRHAKCTAR
jgi:hypothetical protein